MQQQENIKIMTIQELRNKWNAFVDYYNDQDCTMQTFYYTLVNMLKLPEAKHILEIACGLGKLIPYAATLKTNECTYLASDLAQKMVQFAQLTIETHIKKIGVTDSVENWLAKHNITFKVHNGQELIQSPFKFDRIICNLVLMTTQNPKKMLINLGLAAQQGCLLGLTIWGNKELSNFLNFNQQAYNLLGRIKPKMRQSFHLYNKLQDLVKETGWQIVVQWDQNAPFKDFQLSQNLQQFIRHRSQGDQQVTKYNEQKVIQTFKAKKILNFPVQMAILRKI